MRDGQSDAGLRWLPQIFLPFLRYPLGLPSLNHHMASSKTIRTLAPRLAKYFERVGKGEVAEVHHLLCRKARLWDLSTGVNTKKNGVYYVNTSGSVMRSHLLGSIVWTLKPRTRFLPI